MPKFKHQKVGKQCNFYFRENTGSFSFLKIGGSAFTAYQESILFLSRIGVNFL
ncbi:MAG: hypothetical protein WC372_05315 [Candidatus Neomarinimicrobiota bacterium]|jgi:hypothetical protein